MTQQKKPAAWVAATTALVMIAFAANSVLCRAALKPDESLPLIDPATYSSIRVIFGAIILWIVSTWTGHKNPSNRQTEPTARPQKALWKKAAAAFTLTVYLIGFSFAYVNLDTASGTLILFALVQLTMLLFAICRGEWPTWLEIAGLFVASTGLAYLLIPKTDAPSIAASLMMAAAGIGWGIYSMIGRGSSSPVVDTANNFSRSVPMVLVASVATLSWFHCSWPGFWLAAISGAVTSGLGYVLWYWVLPDLRATQAASVQLSVPVIAAMGGVVFAGDRLTYPVIIAGVLILGGIAMTVVGKRR